VAITKFESQHPGVKVELQTITDEQKTTTNTQVLTGNNPPDIGLVPTNAQSFPQLANAKQLTPLDDVWQQQDLEKGYGASLADTMKVGGTPYVILVDQGIYNLAWYNTDAFKAAGITVPANHQIASNADLYSMTKALKAKGYEGLSISGNDGYQLGWLLDAQLFSNASKPAFADLTTSWQTGQQTVKYTDPEFLGSVQQIKDWFDNGVFPNGMLSLTDPQAQALFTSGKAAMLLGGTFTIPIIDQANPSFQYDWLTLPSATAGNPTLPTQYGGDCLGIPAKAANQDLAKQFLSLISSPDMQVEMAKASGMLPSLTTVDTSGLGYGTQLTSLLAFMGQNGASSGWTSIVPGALAQTFFDTEAQKLLAGQETVAQLGEKQQQQFETFVSQNG